MLWRNIAPLAAGPAALLRLGRPTVAGEAPMTRGRSTSHADAISFRFFQEQQAGAWPLGAARWAEAVYFPAGAMA